MAPFFSYKTKIGTSKDLYHHLFVSFDRYNAATFELCC